MVPPRWLRPENRRSASLPSPIGRDVVAKFALMPEMVARRPADIGIAFADRHRDTVSAVSDVGHAAKNPVPVLVCDLLDAVIAADLKIEGRAGRSFLEPWRRARAEQ